MAVHLDGLAAVLGEERVLEGGLAAREVEQLVAGRGLDDGSDWPAHAEPDGVVVDDHVADAWQRLELGAGTVPAKRSSTL
jgi:hypothetical protein